MKSRYDYIIGIDPDCDRSGVAVFRMRDRHLSLMTMDFPTLVQYLRCQVEAMSDDGTVRVVVVEASWKTQSNWHGRYGDSRRVSAKKGYDVGRNHETGRKIVEMAESTGLPVIEKVPLRKVWKGKDGKITHGELVSLLNGSLIAYGFTRTNQEERDSALLAIDASGIPMRMRGGVR